MLEDWKKENNALVLELTVGDFIEAVDFVNQVAKIAEDLDHHPDVLIHGYNQVKITTSTHTAGGLTEKDYDLAEAINKLVVQFA